MSFDIPDTDVIRATKLNLKLLLNQKQAFWNAVYEDCVIAGGCFASMFTDEAPKDFDVFILNKNTAVYEALTDYPNGHEWKIRDKDAGQYLQNPRIFGTALDTHTKVQYILTDYTSRRELLDSFDFKHCTVSYVPKEDKLYITPDAYNAIRRKELVVNGNNKPKVWREEKFTKRGWKPVNDALKVGGLNVGAFRQSLEPGLTESYLESYQKMREEIAAKVLNDVQDVLNDVQSMQPKSKSYLDQILNTMDELSKSE
jgi:hypothetical protein